MMTFVGGGKPRESAAPGGGYCTEDIDRQPEGEALN
jgi:hypothetical protein